MNLLFAHEKLGAFGGAETNIRLTAQSLAERGHRLSLLYRTGTGRNEEEWKDIFHPVVQLPPVGAAEVAAGFVRRFQPDLIYLHAMEDLGVLEALVESARPVVRMVHDHQLYCLRGYKYNWFTRAICTRPASARCVFPCLAPLARRHGRGFPLRWASYPAKRRELRLSRQCARFVVYSEYSKAELVRNGFDPATIVVHAPIPCPEGSVAPAPSARRNLLLYVGQIIRGKGVDVLLRALARVRVPFECRIVGDGSHRAHCERLSARLGLGQQVRFLGYVPPGELNRFYREAAMLVVSSVWPEPFGMVGPEAMRHALPVVAFDAGGIREWLVGGETGFLVPWMDVAGFAMRVEALLGNPKLAREMGRRGFERVRREFNATRHLDELEALFQGLVMERRQSVGAPAPERLERRRPAALALGNDSLQSDLYLFNKPHRTGGKNL